MSTTSSSRKRRTSSRKTHDRKSNIKSRINVLQILNSSSDDVDNYNDENNKTNDNINDNSNHQTNDNSNDTTNDNDDEDFNEEDEHDYKVASQIITLHPEFRDSGMYHVIYNMKKVNRSWT
jgi:hypothetical protein